MRQSAPILQVQNGSVKHTVLPVQLVVVVSFANQLISLFLEIPLCNFRSFDFGFFLSLQMLPSDLDIFSKFFWVVIGGTLQLGVYELLSTSA